MVVSFGGIAFFVYFCMKKKKMIKLFRYIMAVGLLGVIASCDSLKIIPMNIDNLNTNIIELPIDTDSARMEIGYSGFSCSCLVYLHVPEGCEVNEDSLDVSFNVFNYSSGMVGKGVLNDVGRKINRRPSPEFNKIEPTHILFFHLYNSEPDAVLSEPARMYLKMSGVIVKNGKSLMNDTITVVDLPKGIRKPN